MKTGCLFFAAFMLIFSACVSKESIVIPPAKPFDHPQLSNLAAQTLLLEKIKNTRKAILRLYILKAILLKWAMLMGNC